MIDGFQIRVLRGPQARNSYTLFALQLTDRAKENYRKCVIPFETVLRVFLSPFRIGHLQCKLRDFVTIFCRKLYVVISFVMLYTK